MATVLQLVQQVAARLGTPTPQALVGTQDDRVAQLAGLLEDVGDDIAREYTGFPMLSRTSRWTGFIGEDQGDFLTLLGAEAKAGGYGFLLPETFWDETLRVPVFGGLTAEQLANNRVMVGAGPRPMYQLSNQRLLLRPAPTAVHTYSVAWKSVNWLNTVPHSMQPPVIGNKIASDSDVPLFDDHLMRTGLRAYWLRAKGLAYADDFANFHAMCESQSGRTQGAQALYLDGGARDARPGILVPSGSWRL